MQKKLKKRIIALAVLAAVAAVGVTLGFMFKKAATVNTFTPAAVSCAVHEKVDNEEVNAAAAEGDVKSDIRVENTGNIKEFLRLRLVSYFVDENGNVSGSEPSAYPDITLNDKWIAGAEHTYYYPEPIEPQKLTPALCEPFTLEKRLTQDGKTVYQVVEVFAEAIQAEPNAAAAEAWNVTVSNGIITSAP